MPGRGGAARGTRQRWIWHDGGVTRELRLAVAGMAPELVARLLPAVGLDTLEDVLRFGFAQQPVWELADVIVQDEFTHDVIVAGPAPAFLVFDTT
jgi:hypothetical protein